MAQSAEEELHVPGGTSPDCSLGVGCISENSVWMLYHSAFNVTSLETLHNKMVGRRTLDPSIERERYICRLAQRPLSFAEVTRPVSHARREPFPCSPSTSRRHAFPYLTHEMSGEQRYKIKRLKKLPIMRSKERRHRHVLSLQRQYGSTARPVLAWSLLSLLKGQAHVFRISRMSFLVFPA